MGDGGGGEGRGWERMHRVWPKLQMWFCVLMCERISLKMVLPGKIKSCLGRGAQRWVWLLNKCSNSPWLSGCF